MDAAESLYELFFHRSPKPMYAFDVRSLQFVDVNDAALALYGYDRPTFLGMTALDIRPPEEAAAFMTRLRTGDPGPRIWHHCTSDGADLSVEVDWTRHEIEGRVCELVVVTDVTQRERALARLAESEERFRNAVDLLGDGFHVLSAVRDDRGAVVDFRFEYANDAACRLLGRAKHELVGARWRDLWPQLSDDVFERYRDVLTFGSPIELETEGRADILKGTSGERRLLHIRAARVGDHLGIAFGDVTERRRAERTLRESEERFRTMFEASPIGIAIVDPSLGVTDANPALCALLGHEAESLRSMRLLDVVHADDARALTDLGRRLFEDHAVDQRLETRCVRSDGRSVWGEVTASALVDDTGSTVAGIVLMKDITAEKLREMEASGRAADARRRLAELTPRERELLEFAASTEMTARDIARNLHISARTAESHLASVYRKFHVSSRDAAVSTYRDLVRTISAADARGA